ncbi:hypothetical protein MKEN_00509600 [Mycena kentingensis (nom. inval.)]|nr:hypothetical protein MKEN_00509600 [Mycena kentingensis (nom. inval.)]
MLVQMAEPNIARALVLVRQLIHSAGLRHRVSRSRDRDCVGVTVFTKVAQGSTDLCFELVYRRTKICNLDYAGVCCSRALDSKLMPGWFDLSYAPLGVDLYISPTLPGSTSTLQRPKSSPAFDVTQSLGGLGDLR